MIIRPEGRWHLSGVLEQSASTPRCAIPAEEESLPHAGSVAAGRSSGGLKPEVA